jgi:RNAse (barnase) inhibitor barstar
LSELIELDASRWREPADFYDALLPKLGAPEWHGRNLDALSDSIFGGSINDIEPPFDLCVTGTASLSVPMKLFLRQVAEVFAEGASEAEATISFSPPL